MSAKKRVRRVRAHVHTLDPSRAVGVREREERLAVEEPLEIRVAGQGYAVTMRTPGDDFDLVTGFLVGDGVVRSGLDLTTLRYCAGVGPDGLQTYNVVDAGLSPGAYAVAAGRERRVEGTSACGVCGLASIDAVATVSTHDLTSDETRVDVEVLASLPDLLRERQADFDRTGGVHAAGLFTADGVALIVREDVGRHNAVDKVVGWAHREGRLPAVSTVLQVSGRASFELAQKAVMAGIPVLAAVSAPSALAVELAEAAGLTLVGFSRGDRLTVYAGEHRIRG